MVPGAVVYLAAVVALILLVLVPVLVLWDASKAYRSGSRIWLVTLVSLLAWLLASACAAGIWFLIVVAAHSVRDTHLYVWIGTNIGYAVAGAAIVLLHRSLSRRAPRRG